MSLNKNGEMMTKEIMEILLGGAVVLLLLILLYNLISPNFDKGDETAKAYFERLEAEIVVANNKGVGSFSIWQPSDKDEKREFFLVYFGDHSKVTHKDKELFSLGDNLNHICICFWEDGVDKCQYCKNLALPIQREGGEETWSAGLGVKFEIKREEGYYDFIKVSL